MQSVQFRSYADAKKFRDAWRKNKPGAKLVIQQVNAGNRVGWQVVQTNRFVED